MTDLELRANGLTFSALAQGDTAAPLVFCLHGFPDNATTFRHQLPALAEAGYRAIAPTMRGYESGSQPDDGDYSLMSLASDVVGWLDHLGVEQAHLVGHDWGAGTGYTVGAHHPERLLSLTTLAIPPLARIPGALRHVPRQLLRSWYMTWFQTPWLSDLSLAARDLALVRRLWRSWSPGYTLTDEEWHSLHTTFTTPGVAAAAIAYYRQNATPAILLGLRSTPAMREPLIPVPTLIVNGADDGCMDHRLYGPTTKEADFPAGVSHTELPDAGHFIHLERPDRVNELILEHLSR